MVSVKLSDNLLCGDPASDYLSGISNELENESSAEEIWDLDSNTVKRYNNAPLEHGGDLDGLGPLPPFSIANSSLPSNNMLGDPYSSGGPWSNGGHHGYPRQSAVVGRGPQHQLPGYPSQGPGNNEDAWMMGASGVGSPLGSGSKRGDDLKRLKTYQCEACDKWFTSSGHLKRHYNTTLHKNATRQKTSPLSTHSEGSPLSGSSSRPHSGLMPYGDDSMSFKSNQPSSPTSFESTGRGGSLPIHHHSISTLNNSTSLSNNSGGPSLINNNNHPQQLPQTNTSSAASSPMSSSSTPLGGGPPPITSSCNNNNINSTASMSLSNRSGGVNVQSPFYHQVQGNNSTSPVSGVRSAPSPGVSGKMTPVSPMHHHHMASSPMRQQQVISSQQQHIIPMGGSPHNNRQGMSPSSPAPLGSMLNNPLNHESSSSNLSGEDSNQSGGKVQSVTDCLLYGRHQGSPSSPLMRGTSSFHQQQQGNGPNSPANMYSPDSAVIVGGRSVVYSSGDMGMSHPSGGIYTLAMSQQQHRGMDHYAGQHQQSQQFSYHSNYNCPPSDFHGSPSPHHPNGGLPSFQSSGLYAPSPARYTSYGQHLSMSLLDSGDMDMKKEMDILSSSDHLSVTAGDGLDGMPTCSTPSDCGASTPGLSGNGGNPSVGGGGSSGGGDFRCNECKKGFNRICYLKQHNKSFHNGENNSAISSARPKILGIKGVSRATNRFLEDV